MGREVAGFLWESGMVRGDSLEVLRRSWGSSRGYYRVLGWF